MRVFALAATVQPQVLTPRLAGTLTRCAALLPYQPCLQLREAEPLRHVKLSRLLTDKLNAAAAAHGPKLTAAMAGVDPAIQQQVQAMLTAAGAAPQSHHH